jgi:hypothetical protein
VNYIHYFAAHNLNFYAFIAWKHQQSARRTNDVDEYFRYIREPPVPHSHIKQGACSWGLEERQQRLYPNLSKMAP